MYRNGVLGTHIDKAFVGADSVAGDSHCLKNGVGVTLKDRTVHERARVALVGVTADILLAGAAHSELPLKSGGESRTAASAKSGIQQSLNNILAAHFRKHLCKGEVAVHCNVLVYFLGVDDAAVAERHSLLLLVEISVVQRGMKLVSGSVLACLIGLVVYQSVDDASLEQMLGNDLGNILNSHS